MLRLSNFALQKNALWVRALGGKSAFNLDQDKESLQETFPDYTDIYREKTPSGKYTGVFKLYFQDEQTARNYHKNRYDLRLNDAKVIMDMVADEKKLWLNASRELTAEMIQKQAEDFPNLVEIVTQKGEANSSHFSLIFEDYTDADNAFYKKVGPEGGQWRINGHAFSFDRPGARKQPRNYGQHRKARRNAKR